SPQALDLGGQALEPLPALTDLLEPLLVLVASPGGRDIGRGDVGPRARERDGEGAADPAHPSTPGDQDALSIEFVHGQPLPVSGLHRVRPYGRPASTATGGRRAPDIAVFFGPVPLAW